VAWLAEFRARRRSGRETGAAGEKRLV